MSIKKIYVLDTSVLVYDPEAIYSFKNTNVVIPITVIEELDRFKAETSDRGVSARSVIRKMDALRQLGSLGQGVTLDNGTHFSIMFVPSTSSSLPLGFTEKVSDNDILLTALSLKSEGNEVALVSKDLNLRIKADVCGLYAEDYLKGNVSAERMYKGWVHIQVPAIQLKKEFPEELEAAIKEFDLLVNEFVLVSSRHNPYSYKVYRYLGRNKFKVVNTPRLRWPLEARNPQQLMALDLLFDPAIQMISLVGPAGTGKTFLALLAGLHQVLVEQEYRKMLISRPVIPLGPDIGYLPGTIEEKLHSWMQPMYDNMYFITNAANVRNRSFNHEEADEQQYDRRDKKGKHQHRKHKTEGRSVDSLEHLIKEGKVSLEAITYMRGRSIPFQFILLDEVQNLSPHEVKTLISRVGQGSKIILAGDPFQIDAVYLDVSSNGLVVATNKFKGQSLFGSVFLESSERSELSKLVTELL